MELKTYQKKVIADLTRYLELLNETKSDAAAFRLFWQEKSAPALGRYQNVIPGVPNLCFKVPTGGGKTFIARSEEHTSELQSPEAISYAVFSANILFLWLILVFLVNSLSRSVKQ